MNYFSSCTGNILSSALEGDVRAFCINDNTEPALANESVLADAPLPDPFMLNAGSWSDTDSPALEPGVSPATEGGGVGQALESGESSDAGDEEDGEPDLDRINNVDQMDANTRRVAAEVLAYVNKK